MREIESRLGGWVIAARWSIGALLWGSGLIAAALVASIPRNELNDVFLDHFHESIEFRRDADLTVEHLTGIYAVEYPLVSGEPGGSAAPPFSPPSPSMPSGTGSSRRRSTSTSSPTRSDSST